MIILYFPTYAQDDTLKSRMFSREWVEKITNLLGYYWKCGQQYMFNT